MNVRAVRVLPERGIRHRPGSLGVASAREPRQPGQPVTVFRPVKPALRQQGFSLFFVPVEHERVRVEAKPGPRVRFAAAPDLAHFAIGARMALGQPGRSYE